MKKQLIASCLMLVSAGASFAQTAPKASTSTESFVQLCNNKKDVAAQNFCNGFGQGVYETYLISRHPKNAKPFICAGESKATRQEHLDAFASWTVKNPQYNQMSAADTILRYLGENYPCKP